MVGVRGEVSLLRSKQNESVEKDLTLTIFKDPFLQASSKPKETSISSTRNRQKTISRWPQRIAADIELETFTNFSN